MKEELTRWLVGFVMGSIVSLCGAAVALWKKWHRRQRAVENGMQCLLRSEIIRQYEKWEERGYCPIYAKEALKRGYDAYHALGGNDVATGLYEELLELPSDPEHNKTYSQSNI